MKPDIGKFSRCGALVALSVVLCLFPAAGFTQTPPHPGPFEQGEVRVGFYGGAGSNYGQTYLILGGGGGYYLAVGIVYEKFNNCLSGGCDSTYPEFSFWLSF